MMHDPRESAWQCFFSVAGNLGVELIISFDTG